MVSHRQYGINVAFVMSLLCLAGGLSGCGFRLQGINGSAEMLDQQAREVQLKMDNGQTDFLLKQSLEQHLQRFSVKTTTLASTTSSPYNQIDIRNVQFQKYQLAGVLTEVRLILSANVQYHIMQNAQPVIISNPIQVEQSYQYNQASVNIDDPQQQQVKQGLYDAMAQQIADQYFAISQNHHNQSHR